MVKKRSLENNKELLENLENIYFGTIDAYLIWYLTGKCFTDVSNASRTFLMNIKTLEWEDTILKKFSIRQSNLPEIKSSADDFGIINKGLLNGVPILSCLGDQHAASIGHGIFNPGEVKHTYGTGCFLLMNSGTQIPKIEIDSGILTTVLFKLGKNQPTYYALEVFSIFFF